MELSSFWTALEQIDRDAVETAVQLISAMATAAAAVFAALSARSAARSAKEMERARELSSAPVLTITPTSETMSHYFDLSNGMDHFSSRSNHFELENHGNGPALNLRIHFALELHEALLAEEVLVAESVGSFPTKCYASARGIRWEARHSRAPGGVALEDDAFIVSLAKAEMETLKIPQSLMRRWVLDAVTYNAAGTSDREHVAHLAITVVYDTVLRRSERAEFRFQLRSGDMPPLGTQKKDIGAGVAYPVTLQPVVPLLSVGLA